MLTWLQYHKEGGKLSFMDNRNKELEGIVIEVHINITKYGKRVWYEVDYEGEIINVCGETFRKI